MDRIVIIPARGGSKRLPRKNILPFLGKPMITHVIETAKASSVFDRIIVSTEDVEIADIAKDAGAEIFERPSEFATDTAHELDACADVLMQLEKVPDSFCVIYPTSVLLTPEDIQKASALLNEEPAPDVVMGASAYPIHPYKALIKNEKGSWEMLFPEHCKERSQNYPYVMASNGTFYWLKTVVFLENRDKGYYLDRLMVYGLPPERAVDIDTREDLEWAERVARIEKGKTA